MGEHLGVDSRTVHAFIIGEHGDSEIAAWSSANISGIPIDDFCEMRGHYYHDEEMEENIDELGTRFPDMSDVYKKDLQDIIRKSAKDLGIKLQEGVYIQLTGPNFETPAEVRMCRALGADAAGMSTAAEAVVANHMGMRVCGISCISNLGCGMTDTPLSHEEVAETADRVAGQFKQLVTESIINIHNHINA